MIQQSALECGAPARGEFILYPISDVGENEEFV